MTEKVKQLIAIILSPVPKCRLMFHQREKIIKELAEEIQKEMK